jgi:hypothetical protein
MCPPSQLQVDLYQKLLSSKHMTSMLNHGSGTDHLRCISALKKYVTLQFIHSSLNFDQFVDLMVLQIC